MRLSFSLFLFFSLSFCFGQKYPVGLIIEFEETTALSDQILLLQNHKEIKTITEQNYLSGFDVLLVELNSDDITVYEEVKNRLALDESIAFVSVFYKTNKGAFGGDLNQLYLKSNGGHSEVEINTVINRFSPYSVHQNKYLADVWEVKLSKESGAIRAVQDELLQTGYFDFVSVNTLHTLIPTIDDPYFEHQWALENEGTALHFDGTPGADMQITDAWDLTTGSPDIKIAVLDSGTDTNHIDLEANLLPGFDGTGDGSKGYPNETYSSDSHGTATAGIIAAVGDNAEGVIGVAYSCKIIPVKIFYYVEFGGDVIPLTSAEAGIDGMLWALNEANADILSNSWGLRETDIVLLGIDTAMSNLTITEGVLNGRDGKGTPMLFSSGNEYDDFSIWPASHPLTISVGASSMCDELKAPTDCSPEGWWGSNYGENLDVVAPGVKVLTTDMSGALGYNDFVDNNYSMFNGTSAACPNAAGVMALILSVDPELSSYDARAILSVTAEKVGDYTYDTPMDFGFWSEKMGYGRVNAYEAVYYTNFSTGIKQDATQKIAQIYDQNGTSVLVLNNSEPAHIKLFQVSGQFVAETIAVSNLTLNDLVQTPGVYLVAVEQGTTLAHLKVVVK